MTTITTPLREEFVSLSHVTKTYGSKTVLSDLSLDLHRGELLALLGPSGCGKTTTLRILAGLETPDAGTVHIGKRDVTAVDVRRRGIGIVFQSYSLFPHMTAAENVGYGLRIRRQAGRAATVAELLETVGLAEHAAKYPAQLSGGQQQRVALARALALEPNVLLLDEPLSALDAAVRVQLREHIRRIQMEKNITTLMVTHDQEEALTMADRVGVMNAGRIEQLDTPAELYRRPVSPFVATFVGNVNRMPAQRADNGTYAVAGRPVTPIGELPAGTTAATALIRPEDIAISHAHASGTRPGLTGVVHSSVLRGSLSSVYVDVAQLPQPVRVDLSTAQASAFAPGADVSLQLLRSEAVLEPASPATAAHADAAHEDDAQASTASGTAQAAGVRA